MFFAEHPEGRKGIFARCFMTKRFFLFLCVLLASLMICGIGFAAAAAPVTATMELNPAFLAAPGEITVTISVSNITDQDLTKPVTLYDNLLQPVADFGTSGELLLKAGETYTWTGTCNVDQNMLDHGLITYSMKYYKVGEDGQEYEQTAPIQAKLLKEATATLLQVQRTITPQVAKPGTEGTISYTLTNAGTVTLTDIKFTENPDISSKTHDVPDMEPGKKLEIKLAFTMGEENLTSGATITYFSEESTDKQAYVVEDRQILCGNSSISAKLTSSSKGAVAGSVITLTLTLKNDGTIDFSDIRVTDPVLGDVFTNQQLAAGKELVLTKEITLTESASYQFTVTAMDASGNESVTGTETVDVTAVNPEDALTLSVVATADKTEAYGNPANVRFTLQIVNDSNVAANKVRVMHGETELASFETIPAGESRTLNRDTALSHSGKYQFTVVAQDPLENELTFAGNELQIAIYAPTPPPATPTPFVETPTPAPFVPATYIPGSDPSVGTVPKAIRSWVFPIMIISALLCVACLGLLAVATKRRADKKKASDAAYDHLERARRRDYSTPSLDERERAEKEQQAANPRKRRELTPEQKEAQMANRRIVGEPRDEEPGWDFASSDFASRDTDDLTEEPAYSAMKGGLYDEDSADGMTSFSFDEPAQSAVQYDELYAGGYSEAEAQYSDESDGYTDQLQNDTGFSFEAEQTEYMSDEPGQAYTEAVYAGEENDDARYADDAVEETAYSAENYADPVYAEDTYAEPAYTSDSYAEDSYPETAYSPASYGDSSYGQQNSQWAQYSEDSYYDDYSQDAGSAYYPDDAGYGDTYASEDEGLQAAYYDPAQGDASYTEGYPADTAADGGVRRRTRYRSDN